MVGNKTYEKCYRLVRIPIEEDNKGPRPLLVKMNTVEETELVMENLKNLKDAGPELQSVGNSPDRSLRTRGNASFGDESEQLEHFGNKRRHTDCPRQTNTESPEKPRIYGDRMKMFRKWFTNVDTLTLYKNLELKRLIDSTPNPPDLIAFSEAKPKKSLLDWNPLWHIIQGYRGIGTNMNPNDTGRRMLIHIRDGIHVQKQNTDHL